jgi:hypothetical protein
VDALPEKLKECTKHGSTMHVRERSSERFRCRRCRVEYVTAKRQRLKRRLIEHLGGKCQRCGYSKCAAALHFHHREDKDSLVSRLAASYNSKRVWEEVEKCDLLCANCHAEVHWPDAA